MNAIQLISPIVLCAAAALAGPPVPETPLAVKDLVLARPFTLQTGMQSFWRKEAPTITQGYLLVLDVTPAAVYPRQGYEPILYVGGQTAERYNVGYISGKVIAMVPSVDLKTSPIWFGTPALPEQVDSGTILRERVAAEASGIRPFSAATVDEALARGGKAIVAADGEEMLRSASALVKEFSSDELTLADGLSNDPAALTAAAPASGILWARSFTLGQGYASGQSLVKSGTLIVLDVNPDFVFQREDGKVPTLFVGGVAVERVNVGYISGKVVAVVPGAVDLKKSPVWFGTAGMDRSAVKPFSGAAVDAALALGGSDTYATKADLLAAAASVIRTYAPDEFNLADSLSAGGAQ